MPTGGKASKNKSVASKVGKGGGVGGGPSSASKPVTPRSTKGGTGTKSLTKAIQRSFSEKADKRKLVPADLGAYVNGVKTIKVSGRPDFVWARIRSSTSEVVQVYNDKVSEIWDLPVLIYREPEAPDIWRVEGRDVRRYQDWGGVSSIPPHGASHSFSQTDRTGIDPVWVFKRQYMPFLPRPIASGTMQLYVESDFYQWGGGFRWFGGTGTANLTSHKPTGAANARFVTVYLEGDSGQIGYLDGPEFPAYTPPPDPGSFIRLPAPHNAIPIAAVILMTGTDFIGWGEIYDLRYPMTELVGSGSFVHLYDHGAPRGEAESLDFIGAGVSLLMSGTRGVINIPGGGGGGGGGNIVIWDNGVFLGTGSILDFGSNLDLSISGSVIRIDAQAGGGGLGGTGTATYGLGGNAASLNSDYWRVPVYPFATGSLSIMLNGLWQRPNIDFEEQFSVSGTFHFLTTPPTGSVVSAAWGIPVQVATGPVGPSGSAGSPGSPGAPGPAGTATMIGTGTSTYQLSSNAIALDPPTGSAWRVPVYPYATGSLAIMLNGLWQRPAIDFFESNPGSGTFGLTSIPPTGSVISALWGILAGGVMLQLDHGFPLPQAAQIDWGDNLVVSVSGTRLHVDGLASSSLNLKKDGVSLGNVSSLEAKGQYLYAAITGSQGFLAGQYIADRTPFGSGSPHNIEFEDWPVSPNWFFTGGVAGRLPPFDVNSSWPSHLHVTLSGSQDLYALLDLGLAEGAIGGYFAPQSGSVSVTACGIVSLSSVSADGIGIYLQNGRQGVNRNAISCIYLRAATDNPEFRIDKTVLGVDTFNLGLRNVSFHTRVYLHIERVGTGSWGAAMSTDGLGWVPITAMQTQYFSDLSRINLRVFKAGSSVLSKHHAGFDWVRINHLFLFS